MKVLVFALLLQYACSLGFGRCPKQEYMTNFDVTKFAGRWYEVERSFYLWELYTKCLRLDINFRKPGQVNLTVSRINRITKNDKLTGGIANESKKNPSLYQVRVSTSLPKSLDKFLPGSAFYQVLDTDYKNYAIIWSCSSYAVAHYDRVWILGRKWDLNVDTRAKIYRFLTWRKIDTDRLLISSKNCTN